MAGLSPATLASGGGVGPTAASSTASALSSQGVVEKSLFPAASLYVFCRGAVRHSGRGWEVGGIRCSRACWWHLREGRTAGGRSHRHRQRAAGSLVRGSGAFDSPPTHSQLVLAPKEEQEGGVNLEISHHVQKDAALHPLGPSWPPGLQVGCHGGDTDAHSGQKWTTLCSSPLPATAAGVPGDS